MKKECKILRHGKMGMAIVLPKAYIELFELKIGNVVQLILDKKNINDRELTIRFTDRDKKEKE